MRSRLAAAVALAAVAIVAIVPSTAAAHGLFERADLPIPQWLFGWAAAGVLIVSFVALGALWSQPKLGNGYWRALPAVVGRIVLGRPAQVVYGTAGSLLLALVLWSGLFGVQAPEHNFAPTFVYVIFWVGLVPASVLFGDIFRAFNPWRAIAAAVALIAGRAVGRPLRAPLAYPIRLGYWPATAGLVAFALLELVAAGGSEPRNIALATSFYSIFTFAGMALFGIKPWLDRAEAFSVYFNLFSRLAVFERRGDKVGLRPPLTNLATLPSAPGMSALLAVMIGTVTFDGASEGPLGQLILPQLQRAAESLGLTSAGATQTALALTLLAAISVIFGLYRLGIAGMRSAGGPAASQPVAASQRLASKFAPTLVPIALAYVGAHYLTLLLYQGQAIAFLASDPLGDGSNFFGTANLSIDHDVMGATTAWYGQIGLIVTGHVAALTLAHDRALVLFKRTRQALRSQCWMLAVMVCFTVLALWLLSQANV